MFGGLTGEYEVIKTNAPDEIIIKNIITEKAKVENGEQIEPYETIKKHGFSVTVIGCQYDDELMENLVVDAEFDLFKDYSESKNPSLDGMIRNAATKISMKCTVEGTSKEFLKDKALEM